MRSKKFWLFFGLVILVVLIFAKVMSQPTKGVVIKKNQSPKPKTQSNLMEFKGAKYSFKYVDKYTVSETDNKVELVGGAGVPVTIVITLNSTTAATIDDVSGVKMRQIKNSDYQAENMTWNNIPGLLFIKHEPYELTAFFLDQGKALTVAMVANSNDEAGLKTEFSQLINSIQLN